MKTNHEDPAKLVIIGAPRSGTNMLRDVLCTFDGVATWPCDEINPVWRHGNVSYPDDQIPPELMTDRIARFIRSRFARIAKRYDADTVVEKTCANSLRVDFVDKVLPDAWYVYIVRDGIDAVGSARLRWQSRLDIKYTLKKVRFVPLPDFPVYLFRFLRSRFFQLFSKEKRLGFWGPVFPGLQDALSRYSLDEVCALQWKACVDRSDECFSGMDQHRVHHVRYEDFVRNPETSLKQVLEFAGIEATNEEITAAVSGVSAGSLGKGRATFSENEIRNLNELIGRTLSRHGY